MQEDCTQAVAFNPRLFKNRKEWHDWLLRNHDRKSEVWVVAFKTHTGRKSLTYLEALEEAICYGWIDSRMRRIDDEKHAWRFAPRKPDSIWSLSNRRRAERLINEGRMAPPGMAKIEAAKRTGEWDKAYLPSKPPRMPKDLKTALETDESAWENFRGFAPSYRTTYIHWVLSAKREETRKKRIQEVVKRARLNKKLFMG